MALEAPQEDAVCISEVHLRSRGPMWPVAKSGKNGAPQKDPVCISEVHLRSRGPSGRSQERETKAKRMRPPGLNDQRTPLSRGPSGLPRSGKSGNKWAPFLSRRPVTDRCALSGEYPARAET